MRVRTDDGAAGRPRASRLYGPPLEAVLHAALTAWREGALASELRRHRRLARWAARRLLEPVRRVAGDAVSADPSDPAAWLLLLQAVLAGLRPDGRSFAAPIARDDWLGRTAWRPWLALVCHYGGRPVERFADRYRAREDEPATERLAGLWDLAPSSVYRQVERGRRLLEAALAPAWSGRPFRPAEREAFEATVMHELADRLALRDDASRADWHIRQSQLALERHDARTALWHAVEAARAGPVLAVLAQARHRLAADPETERLLDRLRRRARMSPQDELDLELAVASLARERGDGAADLAACERALQRATALDDPRLLGRVYASLGQHHELRDGDRALACFQESAEFLRQAGIGEGPAGADELGAAEDEAERSLRADYLATLIKIAWSHLMRNDPRGHSVLERAEALRARVPPEVPALAMLEQCWGEVWRRRGQLDRAIECRFRALNRYERLGDRASVLKTYVNLTLDYGEAGNHAAAISWAERVIALARQQAVAPEILASTWLNLGASHFFQGRYDRAIEAYREALGIGQQAGMPVLVGRAHYNLAEAYYKRYVAQERPDDERLGDAHAAAALAAWPTGGDRGPEEATRRLKQEVLGSAPAASRLYDRLLPGELVAHRLQMDRVLHHRERLALAPTPAARAREHLAIAQGYVEIAVRERDAALALLADADGLDTEDGAEPVAELLRRLQSCFERDDVGRERLAQRWREASAGRVAGLPVDTLLAALQPPGAVLTKRRYAELCRVSLATASKQLGQLAALGLLDQRGRGPTTCYCLPGSATAGGPPR